MLVALYTPDGKKIDDADSEHATAGSETISAIAEAAGAYMVEVRSAEKTAQTGRMLLGPVSSQLGKKRLAIVAARWRSPCGSHSGCDSVFQRNAFPKLLTPLAPVCILSTAIFSRRPCGKLPGNEIRNTVKIPLDFLNNWPAWPFENLIER